MSEVRSESGSAERRHFFCPILKIKKGDVKKSAERSKRARRRTGVLRAARLERSSRAIIKGNPQKMRISTKIIYFQDI